MHGLLENVPASHMALAVAVLLVVAYLLHGFLHHRANPFLFPKNKSKGYRVPEDICEQAFSPEKVPEDIDTIVVGSGIGGLATAALLARSGETVLVLEQHDRAGGCCHTFDDHGYEFDTGIHYVGLFGRDGLVQRLSDAVTGGKLKWAPMLPVYDTAVIGKTQLPFEPGKESFRSTLLREFPGEDNARAIDEYMRLCKEAGQVSIGIWLGKIFSDMYPTVAALGLTDMAMKLMGGLMGAVNKDNPLANKSLQEVLDGITDNKRLQLALCYLVGDHGMAPSRCPFFLHAVVARHYVNSGGFYPVGSSQAIPAHAIEQVERGGGRVLVKAFVKKIIVENQVALGVEMMSGIKIYAAKVVSGAGAINTFTKLLPEKAYQLSGLAKQMETVQSGPGHLYVFVGLDGSQEELQLPASNYWVYKDEHLEENQAAFLENPSADIPGAFFSFPSAKDPEYNQRVPGKSVAVLLTEVPYEWFADYKEQRVNHREQSYKDLKEMFAQRLIDWFVELFPHLEDRIEFHSVGTPVTNNHYLNAPNGESYGLDHTLERMQADFLKPRTPIKNLWLTGQDVTSVGFVAAMMSGLMTTSAILQRNLFADLMAKKNPVRNEE